MGCVQAKPSTNSPPRGLEKLKLDNGYVGKGGFVGPRRSTGQRHPDRFHRLEPPQRRNSNAGFDNGSGEEERVIGRGGRNSTIGATVENIAVQNGADEVFTGWPKWLVDNVPTEVLAGLVPKSADNYVKLDKVGQGTYSNVYKARDRDTGKIVALKKVRFDTSEPESVKFMAREIMMLQKLDHPNIVKLEGLATSRMQYSLYLVFDLMQSDLARVVARPEGLTLPQIKCYMHQLLSGLQHCHERGILHRDIKGSNLLIDKNGMLKIADFGLANFYSPNQKRVLTSRVVTLWYRAPELLLGSTNYGVGIDLWSAGCLLAEMLAGRPIMPGRTEVEQLHKIFKLCGTPSEDYWKKLRLSTTFRPPQSYRPSLLEAFSNFPESSLGLLSILLALDPAYRGCASSALQNEFFYTSPLACDLSGLPVVYDEEAELMQAKEQRQQRRMKRRSRTHREGRRKDEAAEIQKEKVASPFQETDMNGKTILPSQELGSSASSTSSGITFAPRVKSPALLLSPVASSHQKIFPRSQDHPNAVKSIKNRPPLPTSKVYAANYNNGTDNSFRLNQVQRSASTREFRKMKQAHHIGLYAIED